MFILNPYTTYDTRFVYLKNVGVVAVWLRGSVLVLYLFLADAQTDRQRMDVQYMLICRRVRPKPSQPNLGQFWFWPFGIQTQTDLN